MHRYDGERVGEWVSARVHVCEYVCGRMDMDAYVGSAQHARACACACAGEGTCAYMHRYGGVREGKWVCVCVHVGGYVGGSKRILTKEADLSGSGGSKRI